MLPAVLEWNSQNNSQQQKAIADALGHPGQSAADAVRNLIASLDLPTTLQQLEVQSDQLPAIAERAIKHPVVRNNPRRLESAQQVMEILQIAWG